MVRIIAALLLALCGGLVWAQGAGEKDNSFPGGTGFLKVFQGERNGEGECKGALLSGKSRSARVVMYSGAGCSYCTQGRNWLNLNRIAYSECNIDMRWSCKAAFKKQGGQGVPYFVIHRDGKVRYVSGFDPGRLEAALKD